MADSLDWDELRSLVKGEFFPIVWIRVRSEPAVIRPPLHAVVVTGAGKQVVMINPALSGPDYTLSEKEFREAWYHADNLAVVIRK